MVSGATRGEFGIRHAFKCADPEHMIHIISRLKTSKLDCVKCICVSYSGNVSPKSKPVLFSQVPTTTAWSGDSIYYM